MTNYRDLFDLTGKHALVIGAGSGIGRATVHGLADFGAQVTCADLDPKAAEAVGKVKGRTLAFVGLERIGGVAVYDVSTPTSPKLETYVNTRNFAGDPNTGAAGDLGPEGMHFISADESPTGKALVVATHEVSGTVVFYQVNVTK